MASSAPTVMKAVVFSSSNVVNTVTDIPRPAVRPNSRDMLVRVCFAGLCGSDIHPYTGREPGLKPRTVMGHEVVGVVVECGEQLEGVRGQWLHRVVVAPFTICCGMCWACQRGNTARCAHSTLLGWKKERGEGEAAAERLELDGAQGEYIVVPYGDSTLMRVPSPGLLPKSYPAPAQLGQPSSSFEPLRDWINYLFCGDILATAWHACEQAGLREPNTYATPAASSTSNSFTSNKSDLVFPETLLPVPEPTIAVVGCGPVGLLALLCALQITHDRGIASPLIVAFEPNQYRRKFAQEVLGLEGKVHFLDPADLQSDALNNTPVHTAMSPPDPSIAPAFSSVIECVGATPAIRLAYDLVRPGGVISCIGVNTDPHLPLSQDDIYNKNLTYRVGRCDARRIGSMLIDRLAAARQSEAQEQPVEQARYISSAWKIATHVESLDDAQRHYTRFAARDEGYLKVIFHTDAADDVNPVLR